MEYIQISDSNRMTILDLFNKSVDSEGFIIDKVTGKKERCPYSKQHIKKDNFSIIPGSAIFVNNYPYCFSEHIVKAGH